MSVAQTKTTGRLELGFTHDCSRTNMHVLDMQPPLKVVRAFHHADGAAVVHLHNVSGGVLSGDILGLSLDMADNAQVQITSTGATRVYCQRAGESPSSMHTRARVASGGLLEYVPDAIIPYARARFRQVTEIELDDDAGLFWWEMLSPGREAFGEQFAYHELEFMTSLSHCGTPILIDHARLHPDAHWSSSPARFGSFQHLATFYVLRVGTSADALEHGLAGAAQKLSESGEVSWGVSALSAHGVLVRGLAHTSRALLAGLTEFWQRAKQLLYGRAAIPPRKTY